MAWQSHADSVMQTYDYTELDAWKRAVDLAVAVYSFSAALPLEERCGLIAQVRRASVWFPQTLLRGSDEAPTASS